MNIQNQLENCENCRDVERLEKKIRSTRSTLKTIVSTTINTSRAVTSLLFTKKTVSEGVKCYNSWNKFDKPEEKVQKVTPVVVWGVSGVISDSLQKATGLLLKNAIENAADDKLYDCELARKRFQRKEQKQINNGQ